MQQVAHFVMSDRPELKPSCVSGLVKVESLSDRDAGFCSGEEEETDLDTEYHSPTDNSSRDSSDTKSTSVDSFRLNRHKRKRLEPRKVEEDIKKRKYEESIVNNNNNNIPEEQFRNGFVKYERTETIEAKPSVSPFRPWSCDQRSVIRAPVITYPRSVGDVSTNGPVSPIVSARGAVSPLLSRGSISPLIPPKGALSPLPPVPSGYIPSHFQPPPNHLSIDQEEPLSLVVDKKPSLDLSSQRINDVYCDVNPAARAEELRTDRLRPQDVVRIPGETSGGKKGKKSSPASKEGGGDARVSSCPVLLQEDEKKSSSHPPKQQPSTQTQQRNYKNMTRERRIEANARERTRVHTISAAFDTLRKSVPAYAHDQKLSKLSVLRIACSYIMTLSRVAGYDYSEDQSAPAVADCVDNVCSTIQLEGKTRKKKDE